MPHVAPAGPGRAGVLTEGEARFRRLVENIRDLLCVVDPSGEFAYLSPSVTAVLGYDVEDLLGSNPLASVHEEDRAGVAEALASVLQGGGALRREFRCAHKAGHYVWLEANAAAMRLTDGTVKGCVVTARDITERRDAAARLRESEQRYAALVENVHDAIIWDDVHGRIVFANQRFIDWFGLAGRDLKQVRADDHVAPEWRLEVRNRRLLRLQGVPVSPDLEYEGIDAEGRRRWLDVISTPVYARGEIVGTQSVMRDITVRKQAEHASQTVLSKTALVVGTEFYRALVQELGQVLDFSLVSVARVTAPARLRPLAHYCEGKLVEAAEFDVHASHPCARVLSTGAAVLLDDPEIELGGAAGEKPIVVRGFYGVPLRTAGCVVQGVLMVAAPHPLRLEPLQLSLLNLLAMRAEAEFVREAVEADREQIQARLFQSQKFEALGTLAGGVAHDFNNILSGVMNFTALAQEDCPDTHPHVKQFFEEVLKCSNRARDLVRQILLFSRSEEAPREPLLLQDVIQEVLPLLRSTVTATVEIVADIDPSVPTILGNGTQLHRVLMNLCVNAMHAMAQQSGVLTVRLRTVTLDSADARRLATVQPGPHVCLEVADTGCGMDPAVAARIFEPFFTTKRVGQGTGLGLAVVHSVVQSHEGAINVKTQRGAGTTFEIFLPVFQRAAVPALEALNALPRGDGRRVMLVDDEDMLVRSLGLMLERLGYHVTAFGNAERAAAEFQARPNDFDVVITDYQMPTLTGLELARRLLADRPGLPVYISSGYTGEMTAERLREAGVRGVLQKPIVLAELAQALVGER